MLMLHWLYSMAAYMTGDSLIVRRIWLEEPLQIVSKYAQRADAYQEEQITIAYYVIWEDTAEIAHKIASEISKQSPETVVKIFNVAKADKN